ncbi:MAG TPA: ATP-binding protein [Polyangiaceae bacterium]|nr:ATP-binding protein [Polyangiaceae bacterium]
MVEVSEEVARLRAENWRLQHELAEQRERYQSMLDNELVGFLVASFELNRFLDTNQHYCDFLGYEREELLDSDPYQFWLNTSYADDREAELAQLQRVVAGEISAYRLRKRFVRKTGEVRWGELAYSAVRDSQGRVRYGVLTCVDVDDRQHELEAREKLQDSLFQAQKLETIGRLVGGVAHDFNNRLLVIMGHADILQRSASDSPLSFHAEIVVSSAKRAAELTRQLLAYSRRQMLRPQAVDANSVVEGTRRMLERVIDEPIEIISLPEAKFPMLADSGQLEQVLMNLILNARDAMPDGGRITLQTFDVQVSDTDEARIEGLAPGAYVAIAVRDTGSGISEAARPQIFEPFFTTKEIGRGTGLGLASVEGIVRQSGGSITVVSSEGQGSTFTVYLPRATTDSAQLTSASSPVAVSAHLPCRPALETVLLVDDQDDVRGLLAEVLRLGAYRVLEAKNGVQALTLAETHADPIDLLVTDIVMPGISGVQLAEALRQRNENLKVLFMSGYAERDSLRVLQAHEQFIPKPFLPDELYRHVNGFLRA